MQDITGDYQLLGVREMASGFLLNADNSFRFFLSYGALDRYASGTWKLGDGRIELNSAEKPAADFTLVHSNKKPGEEVMIGIDHQNPLLLRHVFCSLDNGEDGTWKQMSQEGICVFPQKEFSSVAILFEFCPERFSTIPVTPGHNEFVFRPETWLMEVFLENFSLSVGENELSGGHPLMDGDEFVYAKAAGDQ